MKQRLISVCVGIALLYGMLASSGCATRPAQRHAAEPRTPLSSTPAEIAGMYRNAPHADCAPRRLLWERLARMDAGFHFAWTIDDLPDAATVSKPDDDIALSISGGDRLRASLWRNGRQIAERETRFEHHGDFLALEDSKRRILSLWPPVWGWGTIETDLYLGPSRELCLAAYEGGTGFLLIMPFSAGASSHDRYGRNDQDGAGPTQPGDR